jgi:hypothetical protein
MAARVTDLSVYCFPGGGLAVLDSASGRQITAAQTPWLALVCERLESLGFNPAAATFYLPDGRRARAWRTPEGAWNWRFIP